MAQLVFKNAPEVGSDTPDVGRSKVVVLFTDGVSNTTKGGELRNPSRAQNEAVEIAARLKSNYQATVYAIGTAAVDGLPYMNYLSSDYPDAQNLSNPGEQIDSPVYTMTAKNANQLNNAFDSVNVSSSETVDLGADTVLRDVISDYFDLPSNITTENIKEKARGSAKGDQNRQGRCADNTGHRGNGQEKCPHRKYFSHSAGV